MRVFWLTPVAFWGLLALAVPILIHLLARDRRRRVDFPTLRFLRMAPAVSIRRRVISEWLLLAARLAVLALAVAALAAPVFERSDDIGETNPVRALVVLTDTGEVDAAARALAAREQIAADGIFASAVFADAATAAVSWLESQVGRAREVVVTGAITLGRVRALDVDRIPPPVGLRFAPAEDTPTRDAMWLRVAAGRSAAARQSMTVSTREATTQTAVTTRDDAVPDWLVVAAPPDEHLAAAAALAAVYSAGVLANRAEPRPVRIEFAGLAPGPPSGVPVLTSQWVVEAAARLSTLRVDERDGAMVVTAGIRATDPRAPHVIARVFAAVYAPDASALEPLPIGPATLAEWTRPPAAAPAAEAPADRGDRRWLWLAAVALLASEWGLARRAASRRTQDVTPPAVEARVA